MDKLLLICVVMAVTYEGCGALEGTEDQMKWMKEFAKVFCQPDKTDDAIMAKLGKCEDIHTKTESADQLAFHNKWMDKSKECLKSDATAKKYTKVNLGNEKYKQVLMMFCDSEYHTCSMKVIMDNKELMAEGQKLAKTMKKDGETELHKCLTEAIKK
ncbi:unnamed protein product [Medioppia subpectinata]|uniref:Uncharacterized protein n=1 Tax=Medioppia subpectinata TaxID=1979941 RepID=A0A7R9L4E5_9ACAR|nr:unnamed protein product [Medioppia subpectinata]CAG2114210.1 unnamed protein product [Medioppia subpectinata]